MSPKENTESAMRQSLDNLSKQIEEAFVALESLGEQLELVRDISPPNKPTAGPGSAILKAKVTDEINNHANQVATLISRINCIRSELML